MADELIEQWQLAVLKVQLDVSDKEPSVITELVAYDNGRQWRLWSTPHPLAAFGLSAGLVAPRDLRVPDDLQEQITRSLRTDLRGEASLWIRLVPPYGFLGAVPWEQSLIDVVDVPLFRVPDRLPLAPDLGRVWSVGIALSARPDAEWPPDYLINLVERLGSSLGPEVDVDVFADARTVARLRLLGWEAPPWARVHEPARARQASVDRVKRLLSSPYGGPGSPAPIDLTSPGRIWADWISTGLAGRAVRALHVVVDALWDAETPVLPVSLDPSEPSPIKDCAFVTADDIRRLADAVGAATLSLGAPPDVTSEEAMRVIADGVGQQRPGATIYSAIGRDPQGAALVEIHRFLAGRSTGRVPRHRSLFAYVQPEHVRSSLAEDWPQRLATTREPGPAASDDDALPAATLPADYLPSPDADLTGRFADAAAVPSWVAASERYVGQQLADLSRSATDPKAGRYKDAYEKGAAEGLAQLQAILAKHAKPS
jgi:hypothetical protein